MKVVVIYQSKYGSTRKYAEWIAEELSADLLNQKEATVEKMLLYDCVIYGGGLYAGGVNGISLIKNNFSKLENKKLVLFTCGLANPEDLDNKNAIQEQVSKVFTTEQIGKLKIFHLRGGMDYSKLSFQHRLMMSMLKKMIEKKKTEELREEDKEMLDTYGKSVDFTNRDSIQPIVDYVHSLR